MTREWIVYSKPNCKYCRYAKSYLDSNNVHFTEVEFSNDSLLKLKEILHTQKVTFPQIFTKKDTEDLVHIGGWRDLYKQTGGQFNYEKLYDIAYLATVNLNQVIDVNYYPVPQTRVSNMRHRPIGLGIQGLADALVLMKIAYDSDEAVSFNSKMMETIYLASVTASIDLSMSRTEGMKTLIEWFRSNENQYPEFYDESFIITDSSINELYHRLKPCKYELDRDSNLTTIGSYSTFDGSPFSQGKFQFDLWEKPEEELMYPDDWRKLREKVIIFGTRNSLLTALMPTASTSQILGNNECFEFFTNNIYTRKTQAGDFVLVNKYLVKDLIAVGLWNDNMKNLIIADDGSIQNIDEIPLEIRTIYKTIWEIKQIWSLKGSVARGPFVDQTQSLNIFMGEPDYQRLTSSHFYGWKNGLKTGMYYLRSKPSTGATKFTIDPNMIKDKNRDDVDESKQEPESCLSCSG
jgi:ribonucleotide reductase alpha subunit/glutaredoxin-related protein